MMGERHDPQAWEAFHTSPLRLAEVLAILVQTGVVDRAIVEQLLTDEGMGEDT
jgi:hypothetical protein